MNQATNPAGDLMVVLTAAEYRALTEDAGDAALARAAKENDLAAPALEAAALRALIAGDLHPLSAWRKAAGLTQAALAERAGIRVATLSNIEGSKIDPRMSTMKALAQALGVGIDDIS